MSRAARRSARTASSSLAFTASTEHGVDAGRILHHLKQRLPDARTTVLLPGCQAAGTRGRALQDGARPHPRRGRLGWAVTVPEDGMQIEL